MREDMKTQIADTFSELLEKEDIDKITVTQLIEKCQISRQTFYYHFHDIMDVLEWTFKRSTQILVQRSLESQDRIGALKEYLSFVRLHHRKLKRLVDSKKWFQRRSCCGRSRGSSWGKCSPAINCACRLLQSARLSPRSAYTKCRTGGYILSARAWTCRRNGGWKYSS